MVACIVGDLNNYNDKSTLHFLCSWSAVSKLWPMGQKYSLMTVFINKAYWNTATLMPYVQSRAAFTLYCRVV